MNVSLTPELEEYVAGKVSSGMYQSASEVVREALRALRQKEEYQQKRASLIADIQEGLDSLDRGEGKPMTAELLLQMKREARERSAQKKTRESVEG